MQVTYYDGVCRMHAPPLYLILPQGGYTRYSLWLTDGDRPCSARVATRVRMPRADGRNAWAKPKRRSLKAFWRRRSQQAAAPASGGVNEAADADAC